jgi:(p)ppGpp synthase/HD superfamily hydrolase
LTSGLLQVAGAGESRAGATLAVRAHQGLLQSAGQPLIAHLRRVAATTPEFARPLAWLHEVLEWTSVTEEQLLADGVLTMSCARCGF